MIDEQENPAWLHPPHTQSACLSAYDCGWVERILFHLHHSGNPDRSTCLPVGTKDREQTQAKQQRQNEQLKVAASESIRATL
ncbi:MAG TPA: hypothetical protein VGK56_04600, partial [Anaerolineales bacterium]